MSNEIEILGEIDRIKFPEQIVRESRLNGLSVWLVGMVKGIAKPVPGLDHPSYREPHLWEFVGVFASIESAESACRDFSYFVAGPVQIGKAAPHETVPDYCPMWYPIKRTFEDPSLPGEDEPTVQPVGRYHDPE